MVLRLSHRYERVRRPLQSVACVVWLAICSISTSNAPAQSCQGWSAPAALALGSDGQTAYLACSESRRILALNPVSGETLASTRLAGEPTGLALAADERRLWVTCAAPAPSLLLLDRNCRLLRRWACGQGACAPVLDRAGERLFVCLRFDNAVIAFDTHKGREVSRVHVPREPVAAALTPDERWLIVANLLPVGPSSAATIAASVTVLDARSLAVVTNLPLPNGSVALRGVAVSPDGHYCAVTHNVARFRVPATQVEYGWLIGSALSLIDLSSASLRATFFLDEPSRGAANPWGVAWTLDGESLCVVHSGTHDLSVIDTHPLLDRLARRGPGLVDEVDFLRGIRKRLALQGNGSRVLSVLDHRAVVAGFFSDSLSVVNLDSGQEVNHIQLGDRAGTEGEWRGAMLFHDATLSHKGWLSCASCHPDGRADALNWDLLNDGLGNPKNTKSLLLTHKTPPAMSTGVRTTAEEAVRSGLRNILFARRPEEEARAIDEFLKGLRSTPSPWLNHGRLTREAIRGRALFVNPKIGCARCHPPPLFTDQRRHPVGTANKQDRPGTAFDTPTLIECWRTAPYLHDGSAGTMHELLTARNHNDEHGRTSNLTMQELEDLAAYLMSL